MLGLGIGDREREFATMDVAYPPAAKRQRALAETVEVIRGVWAEAPFQCMVSTCGCPTPTSGQASFNDRTFRC